MYLWPGPVVAAPWPGDVTWQDSQRLDDPMMWAETDFDVNGSGENLVLAVDGDVALDWAQIVFSDGETEVVDFRNSRTSTGSYGLWNWGENRQVDHIRVMARPVVPGSSVGVQLVQ
jgi:hypothetical protein